MLARGLPDLMLTISGQWSEITLAMYFAHVIRCVRSCEVSIRSIRVCSKGAGPRPQRCSLRVSEAEFGPAETARGLHARGLAHGPCPSAGGARSAEARAQAHPEGRATPVKELPRQGIRGGSSKSSIPRRPHSRSRPGAKAFQLRHGRAGGRQPRGSSHGGDGPNDRRKEVGGASQPRSEGFRGRPPVWAAGSDGRGLQPRRRSCAPSGSPGERTSGT
ncbi:hypothetical protein NDU88_006322 [Pleurodeles waltl]|uniref:Uncharacterized protein n=1 Tax=Pleurodeles waltl TaxID=8319 RepID=A0AAV7WF91_PLEWA|nr:hypothetical protein NDU88_006322 [Pleurodeles waltl]